jgi:putative chitinase
MSASKHDPVSLIDLGLLVEVIPERPSAELRPWVDPIRQACWKWDIGTVREVAAFIAQAAHESGGFEKLEEGLSYSAGRLMQVWPRRFSTLAIANRYARNPQALANFVYANRMGNGPPESGDGWRFRGAGVFQLTGRSNHTRCAKALGIPLSEFPAFIRTPLGAAMSAGWFFYDNDLHRYANSPGIEDETQRINGGLHGLADRRTRFNEAVAYLIRRGA